MASRVSQVALEVLGDGPDSRARVSQAALEVLQDGLDSRARISQVALEVLRSVGDVPGVNGAVDGGVAVAGELVPHAILAAGADGGVAVAGELAAALPGRAVSVQLRLDFHGDVVPELVTINSAGIELEFFGSAGGWPVFGACEHDPSQSLYSANAYSAGLYSAGDTGAGWRVLRAAHATTLHELA